MAVTDWATQPPVPTTGRRQPFTAIKQFAAETFGKCFEFGHNGRSYHPAHSSCPANATMSAISPVAARST